MKQNTLLSVFRANRFRAFLVMLLSALIFSLNAMWPEKASKIDCILCIDVLSEFNGLLHLFFGESINYCLQRPNGLIVFSLSFILVEGN